MTIKSVAFDLEGTVIDVELAHQKYGTTVDFNEVLAGNRGHYERLLTELTIQPREGFTGFFTAVRDMGLKYTIGSLTNEEQARVLLTRGGLYDLFSPEQIVLREHVQKPKPAPDVWIETARRAEVDTSDQLVFEDSPKGIKGAIEVGAYCVGMPVYNRADAIAALVTAGARRIFHRWDEINPQALLDNVNRERSYK